MKVLEFQGKEIFQSYGIQIPDGKLIKTKESIPEDLNFPVIVKSQLPIGGRGKAGGIKTAENEQELKRVCDELLNSELKGEKVGSVLVEEKIDHDREMYFSITIDKSTNQPLLMVGSEGGVDIEEKAKKGEAKLIKENIDQEIGIPGHLIKYICRELDISDRDQVKDILNSLYHIFTEIDADLVEINPLAYSEKGLVALDSKVILDDYAEYKHQDLFEKLKGEKGEVLSKKETEAEKIADKYGVSYVPLDGNVGLISDGAGTGMLTLDKISDFGGKPANFCEMGGKANDEIIESSMEVVLNNPDIDVLLITLIGGLTRMDHMAEGIARYMEKNGSRVPIVIRMCGTKTEEGKKILERVDLETVNDHSTAVKKAVELAGDR